MTRKEMKEIAEVDFQKNLVKTEANVVMLIVNNEEWTKVIKSRFEFISYADAIEKAYHLIDEYMNKGLPHIVYLNGKILGSYDTLGLRFEEESK